MKAVFLVFLVLCVTLFPSVVSATNCTRDNQCYCVSQNPNFVECHNGQCRCLSERGFSGTANPGSPCSCPSPKEIVRSGRSQYCLDVAAAASLQVATARTEILKSKVRGVYDGLVGNVFPFCWNNASMDLPNDCGFDIGTLYHPDCVGRFDPIGVFMIRREVGEYFYPFANPGLGKPHICEARYVYLYGVGDNVFVRVDLIYGVDLPDGSFFPVTTLTESGNFRFPPGGDQILSIDAIIHNAVQATYPTIKNQTAFIEQLCMDLTVNPGSNYNAPQPHGWCPPEYDSAGAQYGYQNYTDCINFMYSIPFGDYGIAPGRNTVVCRRPHADIARFDPLLHCNHAGKNSGPCVDHGPDPFFWPGNYYDHVF